ncbi:hypothetical protein NEIPOLOT_02218 [Neisseria polysaccharea ATCC 43768]|nr:hypothetical protein NEIPOLOT_02218 [Neisseria polysaccharea ATCC 43768]
MGIEEGTFWDEHWVLYGNQFDNKFHILKKKSPFCTKEVFKNSFLAFSSEPHHYPKTSSE